MTKRLSMGSSLLAVFVGVIWTLKALPGLLGW